MIRQCCQCKKIWKDGHWVFPRYSELGNHDVTHCYCEECFKDQMLHIQSRNHSRLGLVLGVEAIRMVETSVASVADIDRGMELGYRHPMGPLKLGDLVGLDVRLAILEHLHRELGEQFRPPVLLRQMVRAGWLGKKTGRGFYEWNDGPPRPVDPRGLLE